MRASDFTFPLGVRPDNNIINCNIPSCPHILVAGQTGSGKSTMLHSMICSLLMKFTPDEVVFHLTDTKKNELDIYNGIPNLIAPVVDDSWDAIQHFQALVHVMENRYQLAQEYNSKNLEELNERLPPGQKLPYILIIVDEIADLMYLSKHTVEESVVRLAQKSRAVGIHLILATQSPRREVVTGLLKANLTSRLAFSTSSELDSRIILDKNGSGQLIGNGDALYSFNGTGLQRLQSPLITSAEISAVVDWWKDQIYWQKEAA